MRDFTHISNISKIEVLEEEECFDITVEDEHCYYANGILSHNCQQEMRLAANYSREKVWADAFNEGRDIHMATAKVAFGVETKEARGRAKSVNFGIMYGMTVYSLADRLRVSVPEAQVVYDAVIAGLPNLRKWITFQQKEARKRGFTFTYYGRPRNLVKYYNTSDPKKIAFADRSAVNTVCQGGGADVLRKKIIEFSNIFSDNKDFKENVIFAFTCYDEINFYIRPEYLETAAGIITSTMYENYKDWLCPLIVEPSVGYSWGDQLPNPIFKDNKVVGSKNIKLL